MNAAKTKIDNLASKAGRRRKGEEAALARFFGNRTAGQVIDRGFYAVLFAIALGILTEISYDVRAMRGPT